MVSQEEALKKYKAKKEGAQVVDIQTHISTDKKRVAHMPNFALPSSDSG